VVTPTGSVQQSDILNNGKYALYVSSPNNPATVIDATDNWWGTTDSAAIEARIYHQIDNSAHPLVKYTPFARKPFHEKSNSPDSDTLRMLRE